jgi:tyrosine-protein kinase Etk/Wzc
MMQQTFIEDKDGAKGFDIKQYFNKLVSHYWLFLLSILIFVGGALAYLRYTPTLFKFSTSILIKPPANAASLLGGSPFAANTEQGGDQIDMGNEIYKLKSAALVAKAVDSLNLDINLSTKGHIKRQAVNQDSLPFRIIVKKSNPENESPEYTLTLMNGSYRLQADDNLPVTGNYNRPLLLGSDTLTISAPITFTGSQYKFLFQYESRESAIDKYIGRIEAAPVPKAGAGMLQVSVRDEFSFRARQFVNILIAEYDVANLKYKNQALMQEMNFLDQRLREVKEELNQQEATVSNFKASNKINNVSSSADEMLANLKTIDDKKTDNLYKSNLLNLIETNLKGSSANGRDEILNASGLQDPVTADLVAKYNDLASQKKSIIENGTEQDPRLVALNSKLTEYRNSILTSVNALRQELITNNSFLSTQEKNVTGRFVTLPAKERNYIEVNRLLGIKESLYMFLLQRKEDKHIEFASQTVADSRVIDSRMSSNSREPQPFLILAVAGIVALILPSIIVLLRMLTNKTVESRRDIEASTDLPIAGEIGYVRRPASNMLITSNSLTPEAEQFRTLRTNIAYLGQKLAAKVHLVTSSVSQEGKSFVSLNMANSYAIRNKKVVLLEFDLRNPGLSYKLDIDDSVGLANYLIGDAELSEIIVPLKEYENLSFISAGSPLPSNPGEIILTTRMEELMQYLKANYDVIVIDTPPVGLVSDALSLAKYADLSFFVIRHRYSLRTSLKLVNKLKAEGRLPALSIIMNGVRDKSYNNGTNYGYGYGYSYGYRGKKKSKNRKRISSSAGV